jgi:hypothetical protein
MNSAALMTEVRSALASVVETFEPSRRVRFKTLTPFKNEIRDLKGRGAAFSTIRAFPLLLSQLRSLPS